MKKIDHEKNKKQLLLIIISIKQIKINKIIKNKAIKKSLLRKSY